LFGIPSKHGIFPQFNRKFTLYSLSKDILTGLQSSFCKLMRGKYQYDYMNGLKGFHKKSLEMEEIQRVGTMVFVITKRSEEREKFIDIFHKAKRQVY